MPFTHHLSDPNSLLGQWVRENLGNTRKLVSRTNKALKELDTMTPPPGIHPATMGTAIDLRVRYYLGGGEIPSLEAVDGANLCTKLSLQDNELVHLDPKQSLQPIMADELVARFFNDLNEFVSETRPHNRLLSDAREDKLNRFCIVLAILDGLFKAFVFDHVRPESFSPFERTKSTHDILNAVSPVMVEDLTRLSRGFSRTFDVLSLDSVTVGPGFAGSDVVDGCEGDLIVDGMLIDLKTTAQPKIAGAWLKQLVCYYLMDLNDSYNITKLGVYLTRQSKLVDWDVPMLLQILTGNGKTDPMELRAEFRAAALQERKRHVGDNETVVPLSSISSPSSLTPRHPTKTRGIVSRLWDWLHRP